MRLFAKLLLTTVAVTSVALPVYAASSTSTPSNAGGNVQGYSATEPLNTGTIVQLNTKNTTEVDPATQANMQNMFGVVIDRSQLLISPSNGTLQNETYVSVSGTYTVLVSTQNGSINAGDYITLSAIDGIGMKADTTQKTVLGRATQSFDGKGVTLGSQTVKDTTSGTTRTVAIGSIPVTISIERNPNIKSTKVDVPQWLQRLGQQIADKQVSPIRIYISLGITGFALITALVVLYAGIRNAIISIGRNPMSKKSIFRALLEIILTSILILVIGLFAVYLLLKL